jgi:hypothetical protein
LPNRPPDDLAAERWILLFLRKLERVEYVDEGEGRRLLLERRGVEGAVELTRSVWSHGSLDTEIKRRFRIKRQVVDMSGVREPKREGISRSEVSVAVPLGAHGTPQLDFTGWAYAFLPVERTGLPFLFNADLLLNTDRSGALENRWNEALCAHIGYCLADSIMTFCGGDASGVRALGLLRVKNDFVSPIYSSIHQKAISELKTHCCIPTATGRWVSPSEAFLPDQFGLHRLVDAAHLAERAGVELAAHVFDGLRPETQQLGLRELAFEDFIKCLEDAEWVKARPDAWFGELYAVLGGMQLPASGCQLLKSLPILRLEDGSTVAPSNVRVYLGLGTAHRYGFEGSLSVLASAAFEALSSGKEKARRLLEQLDVRALSARAVINEHILPRHEDGASARLSDEELISHACYVIDHIDDYGRSALGTGHPIGPVMANLGILTRSVHPALRVRRKASNMYLGAGYQDPHDLEGLWGSAMPERFVSRRYLEAPAPEGVVRDWSKFFLSLRARKTPAIDISKAGEADRCGWSAEARELFQTEDEERIWHFLRIVGSREAWAEYESAIRSRRSLTLDTARLVTDLRKIKLQTTLGRRALCECVLDNTDNRAVFGREVPFLQGRFVSDSFAEVCGVITKPTIPAVLGRIRAIAAPKATDAATAADVEELYRFLDRRHDSWTHDVRRAFETEELILAGNPSDGWLTRGQACWSIGGSLERHCPLRELAPRWQSISGLKAFFIDKLGVADSPTPAAWLLVLRNVRQAGESAERTKQFVRLAYRALARTIKDGAAKDAAAVSDALQQFRRDAVLYCSDGRWLRAEGSGCTIVYSDDPHIEQRFAGENGVAFVAVDQGDRADVEPLLRALCLRSLRETVVIEAPAGDVEQAPAEIAQRISGRAAAIARVLYHDPRGLFEPALLSGDFDFIARPQVVVTPAFRVTVGGVSVDCPFAAKVLGRGANRRLHVGREVTSDGAVRQMGWDAIGHALALELRLDRKDGAILGRLLGALSSAEVEQLLSQIDRPALPMEAEHQLPAGAAAAEVDAPALPAIGRVKSALALGGVAAPPPPSPEVEPIDHPGGDATLAMNDPPRAAEAEVQNGDTAESTRSSFDPRPTPSDRTDRASRTSDARGGELGSPQRSVRIAARARQARLGTYAAADAPPVDDALIAEVDAAAVAFVLAFEQRQGRSAVDLNVSNPDNPGFDIRSDDPSTGEIRFIEVKGTKDEWGHRGVDVSATQLQFAFKHRHQSWLYVVECALDPARRCCYRVQDFAVKVERIAFDGGWRRFAEP